VTPELEAQTRKRRINPRLEAAGWHPVAFSPTTSLTSYAHAAIEEYETRNGPTDHALFDRVGIRGVTKWS
jgi:type I restriction enzyme R subunit